MKSIVFVIILLNLISILTTVFKFNEINSIIYIVIYSSFALTGMLFIVAFLYDILSGFSFLKIPFNKKRRDIIKKGFDITSTAVASYYVGSGFVSAQKDPMIKNIDIGVRKLKGTLSITQVSDLHIGDFLKSSFLRRVIHRINSINSDIVAITGDLVDLSKKELKNTLEPLREIRSRYGVYFVLGNHEYYHGAYELKEFIKDYGVKVLENESINIDGKINLVGIYDIAGYSFGYLKPDIHKAFNGIDPNLPNILLSHQPKALQMVDGILNKDIDLILSGHTHGGQVFPLGILIKMDQKYLSGLYKYDKQHNRQIFVTNGAGFWGPPVRVMAPSEIVKITLQKQENIYV